MTIDNIMISNIALLIILYCIRKFTLKSYGKQNTKQFLKVLDKYYIKNKKLNLIGILIYIGFNFVFIFLLRIIYLGSSQRLQPWLVNISLIDLIVTSINFVLILILIILLHKIINVIFYTEVVKCYFYYSIYFTKLKEIRHALMAMSPTNILGPLCLFFECIYRKMETPERVYYDQHYDAAIYLENTSIKQLISLGIKYTTKSLVLYYVNYAIYLCLYMTYKHLSGILVNVHYLCLLLVFLIDIITFRCIYYTYYALFLFFIYKTVLDFYNFEYSRDGLYDKIIYNYLYKNTVPYALQRNALFNNDIHLKYKTCENDALLFTIKQDQRFILYVIRGFVSKDDVDIMDTRISQIYIKFYIILMLGFMYYETIYNKENIILKYDSYNITYIIIIPIILLGISYNYIFYLPKDKKDEPNISTFSNYIYNKWCNRIFWLLTLFLLYAFWLILFKGIFFMLEPEIIWSCNSLDIQIIKHYTLEEKLALYYQYLTISMDLHYFDSLSRKVFMEYLEFIKFHDFVNDMTLKDLRLQIETFCNNYVHIHNHHHMSAQEFFEYQQLKQQESYMTFYDHIRACFYTWFVNVFVLGLFNPSDVSYNAQLFKKLYLYIANYLKGPLTIGQ